MKITFPNISYFLATLVFLCAVNQTSAQEGPTAPIVLEPISIAYTVSLESDKYGNATLGKAQTTLSRTDAGYTVHQTTQAQGMAAILLGSDIQESCDFVVSEGRAISNRYVGGRSDLTDYQIAFDWTGRKINFSDGESLDMPQGYVVNTCNLPFAAALLKGEGLADETVYVVDGKKKRIRAYKFKSSQEVVLKTKLGDFDTLKVVLERELIPERTFTFWLSPDNSYIPLKMEERRSKRTTTIMVDRIES